MRKILVALPLLILSVSAAEDATPFVSTSHDQVDGDFAFQGEYAGLILPDDGRQQPVYRRVGVQVVALGSEEFSAQVTEFGLPGAGWNLSDVRRMQGTRNDSMLRLYGDGLLAEVADGHLTLKSDRGYTLGQFPRRVRQSPTLGQTPPPHAIVLFDGTSTDEFTNGKMTDDGLLMQGADFRRTFEDFTLHVEFQLPYMPDSRGQKRGNSGVYLQSRYEVQILDSFGLDNEFNHCGALYRYQPPRLNMCFPPLQWQTYDITFRSPRFDSQGEKIQNARLTVSHNGVLVHDEFEIERKTGAGKKESPQPFPIRLQNHRDSVRFRNVWIVDHRPSTEARRQQVATSRTR